MIGQKPMGHCDCKLVHLLQSTCDECKEKTNLDHCINVISEKQQTAFSMGKPAAYSQAVSHVLLNITQALNFITPVA